MTLPPLRLPPLVLTEDLGVLPRHGQPDVARLDLHLRPAANEPIPPPTPRRDRAA